MNEFQKKEKTQFSSANTKRVRPKLQEELIDEKRFTDEHSRAETRREEKRDEEKIALLWEQRDYSKTHCQTWNSSIFKLIYICVKRIRSESKITDILFDETCAITHTHTQTTDMCAGKERATNTRKTDPLMMSSKKNTRTDTSVYIYVYGYVLRIRFSILLSLFLISFLFDQYRKMPNEDAGALNTCKPLLGHSVSMARQRGRRKERLRVMIWRYRFQWGYIWLLRFFLFQPKQIEIKR